jgi:hypothetical protein
VEAEGKQIAALGRHVNAKALVSRKPARLRRQANLAFPYAYPVISNGSYLCKQQRIRVAAVSEISTSPSDEFNELCRLMGLALSVWQRLEDRHFMFFHRMLGDRQIEISSMIYHGLTSFEARRQLVDRIAGHFSLTEEARSDWDAIHKDLETAAKNRNKIAHYPIEYADVTSQELDDSSIEFSFSDPRLRPSSCNYVDAMRGRDPTNPEHNLSAAEIGKYIRSFLEISERLFALIGKVPWPS